MIHLRPFHPDDWEIIAKYQYPSIAQAEAQKLIDKWNVPTYEGKFHKFLAVADDRQIVGYASFIEAEEGTASFGVEIYAPFRRQGYAYAAISQLLTMANACNYHTATAQIRKDNTESLALFHKLGFAIVSEAISKRGKPVYSLVKSI